MPLKRTCAIILNYEGRVVKPSVVAKASGIKTGHATVDLSRLVNMGIARKIGRGQYVLLNKDKAVDFLTDKTQQDTTKHSIRGKMGHPEVMVRPHRIWFKAKVLNFPEIKGAIKSDVSRLEEWRYWTPNQNSTIYEKLMQLPNGTNATVRYAKGIRKRTITVKCEDVLVTGPNLSDHMRDIWDAVEQGLRKLSRIDDIHVGLIQLTCDHHFAIPLPVDSNWRLPPPGIIKINEFWWMDGSKGWPEIETHLQSQAKKLVELPDIVDGLPDKIRTAIEETLLKYLGKPEEEKPLKPPETDPGGYA